MALFQKTNVTLALETLKIDSSDDRWWDVEPYVVPIFFKVDGERYLASLRIVHSQQPREGSGEQPSDLAGGLIQLSLDTVETDTSPLAQPPVIHEDNPYIFVPSGDLLGRGSFDSDESVDMTDIAFRTDLIPIPFRIDVNNTYMTASEAFNGLFVSIDAAMNDAINLVFVNLNDFIGGLFGLNEELESCPVDLGSSDFLNDIDAHFDAMIPGTIGGVFVLMENDAFDESITKDLRSSIRDEVAYVINHVVNGINQTNITPDVNRVTDDMDMVGDIESDLTWPVLGDFGISLAAIGVSIGALLLGSLLLAIPLGLYGILTALSWLIGGFDDKIGIVILKFDHSNLLGLGPDDEIADSSTQEEEDGDNKWTLNYKLTVNSVG